MSNTSAVLSRDLRRRFAVISHASTIYYYTDRGRQILDACGGSAVACLGHSNLRVKAAIHEQMDRVPYSHCQFFTTDTSERLAKAVVDSTDGKMASLLTLSSGSEALEAALKIARQYYLELSIPQPERTRFIARQPSYHGATLTTLSIGGHLSRRAPFEPMLGNNCTRVSQCNAFRGLHPGESEKQYAARLAEELDAELCRLPPRTVCAFVAEPVTGASTGCVTPVEGYFEAVQRVCERHGVLLIMDEIMCGMGRTGSMHAWQQEGVAPNIQVVGKSFGGGYVPISGVIIDYKVNTVLREGSGKFAHGQSFQGHPSASAAAMAVQEVIREEGLLGNVTTMGARLAAALRLRLGAHPHVGDIRGRGLFWAVEFVEDKATKAPFPPQRDVGYSIHEMASQDPYNILVYPGRGTVDGTSGDHILLAPAYNITCTEVEDIAGRLACVVFDYFTGKQIGGVEEQRRQW